MKKLILSELLLLFLATTFMTDSLPPGWYQQTLPVNDLINDIYFLDSLTGWVVTDGRTNINDTGYVMKTTNGGNNWQIQYNQPMKLNAVQFINVNTGYVVGGSGSGTGRIFKTTNGGNTWVNINSFSTQFDDLFFVNKDTGWVADPYGFGGLYKTINGGQNWQLQLGESFQIQKLFFINADTGWAGSNDSKLYRTTNRGLSWNLQYTFNANIGNLFFPTKDTGFVSGGFVTHSIKKTVNGGYNWDSTTNSEGGRGLFFLNNKLGWNSDVFSIVQKTTDGGSNWFRQTVPSGYYYSVQFADSNNGWAGGTLLIHTFDGGGPPQGINQIGTEIPSGFRLFQNYPNPFNPVTSFKLQVTKMSNVQINVYDVKGKLITTLVNEQIRAGEYLISFDGTNYSSGVYFYTLISDGKLIDTKRMILIK